VATPKDSIGSSGSHTSIFVLPVVESVSTDAILKNAESIDSLQPKIYVSS